MTREEARKEYKELIINYVLEGVSVDDLINRPTREDIEELCTVRVQMETWEELQRWLPIRIIEKMVRYYLGIHNPYVSEPYSDEHWLDSKIGEEIVQRFWPLVMKDMENRRKEWLKEREEIIKENYD